MKRLTLFKKISLFAAGLALFIWSTEARAQDNMSRDVLQEVAGMAFKKNDHERAAKYYRELRDRYDPDNLEVNHRLAESLFQFYYKSKNRPNFVKSLDESLRTFQNIIERPDSRNDIKAHFYISRILAIKALNMKGPEKEDMADRVKRELTIAARHGFPAVEAVQNRGFPEYKLVNTDHNFQLSLIKAPTEFVYHPHGRDPFTNPLPRVGSAPTTFFEEPTEETETIDRAEMERVIANIKLSVRELEKLIEAQDHEGVAAKWKEIDEFLSKADQIVTIDTLIRELNNLQDRLSAYEADILILRLRAFYRRGESVLRKMDTLMGRQQYQGVREHFRELNDLAKEMRQETPQFVDAANDLLRKGTVLDRKARKLLIVNDLKINISGIIVGPDTQIAIINNYRYKIGDTVENEQRDPIAGLVVERINARQREVVFRLDDIEFSRRLQEPEWARGAK